MFVKRLHILCDQAYLLWHPRELSSNDMMHCSHLSSAQPLIISVLFHPFSFFFDRSNVAPGPVDQTAHTCVSGLKTCNKTRETGTNRVPGRWRGLAWLSLVNDMYPAVGRGWSSGYERRVVELYSPTLIRQRFNHFFFPQAPSLKPNGDVIPTRVFGFLWLCFWRFSLGRRKRWTEWGTTRKILI